MPLAVASLLLVASCSDDAASGDTVPATAPATEAPTSTDAGPPTTEAAVAPTIGAIEVEANPANVLLATLHVTTDVPARLAISIIEDGAARPVVTTETLATDHTVPIRGLHADRIQTIEAVPMSADGALDGEAATVDITTEPLPFTLPELTVGEQVIGEMAPGFTLFDPVQTADIVAPDEGRDQPAGLLVAVDDHGEVVWYLTHPRPIADARILADGTLMYESLDTEVVFADMDGNVLSRLTSRLYEGEVGNDTPTIAVDTDALHHETNLLPDGHLASLSSAVHVVNVAEPMCGEDPATFGGTYSILSDVVVVVDVESGAVLSSYDLWDLLDPMSDPVRRDFCGTAFQNANVFPVSVYPDAPGTVIDWTHSNAIVLDEARNALLVSVRHLNEILAIRYEDDANGPAGELLWELGEDGTVPYTGRQFTHQHSVDVLADGSLIIYDNANEDPAPQQSRAMTITLEGDGQVPTTASESWEFGSTVDGAPAFSFAVGDADPLPNGNVLVTNGFYAGGYSGLNAQLVEVVPDGTDGGTVVWELRIGGPGPWFVYRAERIPTLYPAPV